MKKYGTLEEDVDVQSEGTSVQNDGGGFEIAAGQVRVPKSTGTAFSFRKLWAYTGPGFLMSIAYLDPGNIESDLQAGAIAKYKLLWVLMWSTVLGLMLQLLAARLGCVTGMNLAEVCRLEYPTIPRYILWIMMEIAIIGSDIQEVIGSAIAINLLSGKLIPIWAGVLVTGADTFTFLFLEQFGLRKLEAFFCTLITVMAAAFLYVYIHIKPNQGDILIGLWFPWCQDCDKDAIQQLVGIVGAVIMPHNIYLHSSLVLSRIIDRTDKKEIGESIMYNSLESAIALFVSFLINLFVVTVFAVAALKDPSFADTASLMTAGNWLFDHYGLAMKIVWGVGILAAGQSSTMTGTYAGQFVMEGFIQIKWAKWKRVLLTRSIAMVPTITVALLATGNLDMMNNWLNVLQSVQLPFALLPVLHFTSSERIMKEFKNGKAMKAVVWVLAVLVMGINFFLVIVFVGSDQAWYTYLTTAIILLIYSLFVAYIALGPGRVLKIKMYLSMRFGWNPEKIVDELERRRSLTYQAENLAL
uniref:Natural resistance-associated macrophage protein 2-like n=1 Tax=Crassostrea virginica TaxID=6565 RepID=A0A8B8D3J5_CRAVI|nr:natural resistance-associated macrophage protein 2-like [Crassostrea virginica]XP_022321377.1 natural resistance-associated macrophage protein 2-like [Crassostrea virginica]XP_022321386.1 natural resistance-associated macrophage protein 2-like [Crassostrea virginica]